MLAQPAFLQWAAQFLSHFKTLLKTYFSHFPFGSSRAEYPFFYYANAVLEINFDLNLLVHQVNWTGFSADELRPKGSLTQKANILHIDKLETR